MSALHPAVRKHEIKYSDRAEFKKHYLSESPHGGVMARMKETPQIGDVVSLRVHLKKEDLDETLRSVVLWRRKSADGPLLVGIGFMPTEVEKRERLLETAGEAADVKERKNTRYQSTMRVKYRTATDFVVDYTRNISAGGFFVSSDNPPDVGTEILFRLYPPGQQNPIDLPGRVAWRKPKGGFGVRFMRTQSSQRNRLDKLVRSLAIGAPVSLSAPVFEEVTPV